MWCRLITPDSPYPAPAWAPSTRRRPSRRTGTGRRRALSALMRAEILSEGEKKKGQSVELIYRAVAASAAAISLCQSRIWLVIFPASVTDGLVLTIKGRLSSCRGAANTTSDAQLCGRQASGALSDFIYLLEDFPAAPLVCQVGCVEGFAAAGDRDRPQWAGRVANCNCAHQCSGVG